MTVQMKTHTLDLFDAIYIIDISGNFKFACDSDCMHKGAAIWIFSFFVKNSASTALSARLASKHQAQYRLLSVGMTTTMATYPQVVNYVLRTYATDENVAKMGEDITIFAQPPNETPSQYDEKLVAKVPM